MARGRRGADSKVLVVVVVLVAVLVAGGVVLLLRGNGDDPLSAAEVAERQGACARLASFRELVSDLGISPPLATAPVNPASVANLFTKMGSDIDLLVDGSPGKVRGDVRTLLGALRAQPGDPGALRSPSFTEARQDLASFLNDPRNGCQSGADSGSG